MKKATYSKGFERFWKAWRISLKAPNIKGEIGSKEPAYKRWCRDKLETDTDELIGIFWRQVKEKKFLKRTEGWTSNMRNCVTWLNQKGYNDPPLDMTPIEPQKRIITQDTFKPLTNEKRLELKGKLNKMIGKTKPVMISEEEIQKRKQKIKVELLQCDLHRGRK